MTEKRPEVKGCDFIDQEEYIQWYDLQIKKKKKGEDANRKNPI